MTTLAASPPRARRSVAARTWAFVKRHALTVYAVLVVGYLMLPIAVVILFSFNHPTGRFNYLWNEFTFENWLHWNDVLGIQESTVKSRMYAGLDAMRTSLTPLDIPVSGFRLHPIVAVNPTRPALTPSDGEVARMAWRISPRCQCPIN